MSIRRLLGGPDVHPVADRQENFIVAVSSQCLYLGLNFAPMIRKEACRKREQVDPSACGAFQKINTGCEDGEPSASAPYNRQPRKTHHEQEQKVIKAKVGLLELAKQLGGVLGPQELPHQKRDRRVSPMAQRKYPTEQEHQRALSDEAAAYIAARRNGISARFGRAFGRY
jgi:hypothetical protein